MKQNPEIIFEDGDVVVVNKPAFMLTMSEKSASVKFNLSGWLSERCGNIFLVHRLDKETSGIMVFAKNEEAHKNLSLQFESHTVEKYYLTLVEGVLSQNEGIIEKPIAPNEQHPQRMVIASRGRASLTRFRVVERFRNYTLAEASTKTGRAHQIRVHFQSIGHPLAVDFVYGRKEVFLLSEVKQNKFQMGKGQEERPLMERSSLHAAGLSFDHPRTKQRMNFEAALPKDFAAVVKQLRKWGKA
ncbi:MAG: RluA family pseudouridine synthase [Saprospiraceae bacterium]|nr:MAG: RluA family pseudouridine synthase [Saprospiraceae bacterium]